MERWREISKNNEVNIFFFQAEDGIRDLVRSRGLGDVYKRQLGIGALVVVQLVGIAAHGEAADLQNHLVLAGGMDLSLIHI